MKSLSIASTLKFALSATLAMALSVTPVSANDWGNRNDHDDTAAVLGLLLGIATLGVLLSGQEDRKDDNYKPRRPHKRVHKVPKHLQLPAHCLKKYKTQQGKQRFFAPKCLKRNFSHASDLPRACKDTIVARNKNGTYVARKIYRQGCLNNHGYRTKTTY
ncbi:hypothetical protein [Aliiroseovarius sp. F47248L]|uniref:hypothetical protein n=1 Tax=Aliiroseovarius sp. F47248L TaxID=2926420 RepID=UPI001FF301DD|nr:hypothetical protein [Aliiroseovarius sp. F47248L]MCK0140235.1 hypothetical protein [Aliiroseovarius sp. F47248L]